MHLPASYAPQLQPHTNAPSWPCCPLLPMLQAPRKAGALSKTELNRVKRGGKGKHGFKSKARHRRR